MISVSSTSRVLALGGCIFALASALGLGCVSPAADGIGTDEGAGGDVATTSTGTTSTGKTSTTSSSSSSAKASASSASSSSSTGAGGRDDGSATTGPTSTSGAGGATGSPSTSSAGPSSEAGGVPSGFDQFQERNLADVNQYRATLNLPPLVLDKTLSTFAMAGSNELTMDHVPHQHFNGAGSAIWSAGFTSNAGENQGDPRGWNTLSTDPVENELAQIDDIQKRMYDEGPGPGEAHGHYENMMSRNFKRLGVGLIEVGTSLYLTNDFSD